MPYHARWYLQDRILVLEIYGVHTLDEMETMDAEILEMIAGKPEKSVFLVISVERVEKAPMNVVEVMKRVNAPRSKAVRLSIIIGAATLIRILIQSVAKLANIDSVRFVSSFEDALAAITEHNPDIQDLLSGTS